MNKVELLSNHDLVYFCKKLKINIKAVTFKDLFKYVKPEEGCYIINLDDSTTMKYGTHWTCLIIINSYALYYDSFGLPIPKPIKSFIRRNRSKQIYYSVDQIQALPSVACGYYVLYFLYFMTVKHKKCKEYRYLLNKHNSIYSLSLKKYNDVILQKLIQTVFQNNKI